MKKLSILFLVMLLAILAGCSDGNSSAETKGKTTEISIGTTQTENSNYSVMFDLFKEEVEKNSDGDIKVTLHYNSVVGDEREMVEAVNIGTLDGVATSTGVITNFVSDIGVLDIPFLFRDKEHARKVMNGPVGETLADKLSEHNFKLLAWAENGFRHITSNKKPVNTPEDLEGLKIRTMEVKIHQEAFSEMGAAPTPMAWGEVFTSLQQGVIDAQENPVAIMYSSKLDEVQKYASLTGHVYSPIAFMLGNGVFDKLTEDQQQIVLDAAKKAQEANYKFMDEEEDKQMDELKESGMEFNEVDKQLFVDAVKPVIDAYKDDFGDLYDQIVNE